MEKKEKNKRTLGEIGEDIAVDFLTSKGFQILERNFFHGHGEIDIIAVDPDEECLVFVEVKTRNSLEFGDPAYAVNKKKIAQLKKIAELYLATKNIEDQDCRFDVITILLVDSENPQIEHYINAFM